MSEKILVVDDVKKSFGKKEVLKGVSFDVGEREIVGFLGRNGAGKSTLMKLLCGLLKLDGGDISVMGYSIKKDRVKVLENIGVSIESPAMYPNLTGRENLRLIANWRKVDKQRVVEMEEYSRLKDSLDKRASSYSMGMKMRLVLAMVLMAKPKLLVLDEPMNGLDPDGVIELRNEIIALKENGSSILFSSHQLSEVEKISDRVVMIEDGKVVFNDKVSAGLTDSLTYLISTSNNVAVLAQLEKNGICAKISELPDKEDYIEVVLGKSGFEGMIDLISKAGAALKDVEKEFLGLEDIYKQFRK